MTYKQKFLSSENATKALAEALAPRLAAADTILLSGEIGAGKTFFCRALIHARLGKHEDVPSPTFTLVQIYDAGSVEIWHCDLYRLNHPDDALELGLDAAMDSAICLIEWPDRLGELVPQNALPLIFFANDDGHRITTSLSLDWAARIGDLFD